MLCSTRARFVVSSRSPSLWGKVPKLRRCCSHIPAVGKVIAAWDAVVPTMCVGETCELVCSAEYGYGAAGAGDVIPPDAALWFQIELLSARAAVVQQAKISQASAAREAKEAERAAQLAAQEEAVAAAAEAELTEELEAAEQMQAVPEPKAQKDALARLQLVCSQEFQQRHEIAGLSGNKLGKIKHGVFKGIYQDFLETADEDCKRLYICHMLGRPLPTQGKSDKLDKASKKKQSKPGKTDKTKKSK